MHRHNTQIIMFELYKEEIDTRKSIKEKKRKEKTTNKTKLQTKIKRQIIRVGWRVKVGFIA